MELDWLKKWNEYSPNNIAVVDIPGNREITYQEMYICSVDLSLKLQNDFFIRKGDRVALMAKNNVAHFILFFALQRLGVILVPINFRLTQIEAQYILEDCGAKLFIHDSEFCNYADIFSKQIFTRNGQETQPLITWPIKELVSYIEINLLESKISKAQINKNFLSFDSEFEDPVMILYTSGTTGKPKGAVITHKMIFWNSINTGLRLNLTQEDVTLCFLPLFHTGGWNVLSTPLLHRGGKLIFLEKFEPELVLQMCDKHKVTILFGVPTTMEMMSRSDAFKKINLESVRYAIVGGEPMPLEAIETWHQKGIPVRQGYGLTEFGPNVFSLNESDSIRKMGSIGFPNFYIDANILDSEGNACGPGEIGELVLKGPMCMKEYWNRPEATRETIVNDWLHTGDLVKKDEEGFYYVVGRKKDMYISGGENVYPAEVEQVLYKYPGVREVGVIGVPDPKWGEVGKAFIAMESGKSFEEEEIIKYCKEKIAKFKVPKYFVRLEELPKGDSGKILKRELINL